MKYGIYGGAFDPLHWGHLLLAESCLRQAELERLIFVPTGISPHRSGKCSYGASGKDRFAMLNEVVSGYEEYLVSGFEISRNVPSYTVETLRHFSETLNKPELYLLTGADMFADMPNWYCAEEIFQLAIPLAARRQGCPKPQYEKLKPLVSAERYRQIEEMPLIEMPLIELSSSKIRREIANGKSIRFQVPDSVEKYIAEHGLY